MNEFSLNYDDIPLDESGSPLLAPIHSFFDVANRLEDLYITFRGRFVMMTKDGGVFVPRYRDPETGRILDKKITNSVVCGHLNGHYSICVFAGSSSSKFICFDVDDGNPQTVKKIIDILSDIGFPRDRIYVSTSGGKGFHVEMFFASIMYTSDLRRIYNYVCSTGHLDTAKVEFRPTSTQSIKLPLSIHRKTGNTCWYLDKETLEPIQNPEFIMEIEQVPHDVAFELCRQIPNCTIKISEDVIDKKANERILTSDEIDAFNDGYYPDLTSQGQRHSLMVQIAVYNRYRGLSKDMCKSELISWYHRQNVDFIKSNEEEVDSDIMLILDWAYSENFVIGSNKKDIKFYKSDIRMILSQDKRSDRRILFLIQYYTKLYGSCCKSAVSIAEQAGLTKPTAISVLHKLEDEKWIETNRSSPKSVDGRYTQFANRHQISIKAQNWASGRAEHMPSITNEKRHDVFAINLNMDEYKIVPDESNLMKSYSKVLSAFVPRNELCKLMTKKEIKEIDENGN